MLNFQQMMIDRFVDEMHESYRQTYRLIDPQPADIIEMAGQLVLENIANSDNLYHDLEHTILVTSVAQVILKGKHLSEGSVSPDDWLQFTLAALCHDIGYVRGVCLSDRPGEYATGIGHKTVLIDDEYTDSVLSPYHVDRSKLFVSERFEHHKLGKLIDTKRITSLIERTRFPIPDEPLYQKTADYPGLLRAADFIGQLGDPNYLRKVPALYYEFEENGVNVKVGYQSPGHMRRALIKFYFAAVDPYISDGVSYLNKTEEGKQWVANLFAHINKMERYLADQAVRPQA